MDDARQTILRRIRRALGTDTTGATALSAATHEEAVEPASGGGGPVAPAPIVADPDTLVTLFVHRVRDYGASVDVAAPGALRDAIAAALRNAPADGAVVVANGISGDISRAATLGHPVVVTEQRVVTLPRTHLADPFATTHRHGPRGAAGRGEQLEAERVAEREAGRSPRAVHRAGLRAASAAVTEVRVAIAETGTIVLDHELGQGSRALSLLPDRHIAVVRSRQIVPSVADAITRLGPSATAGRPMTWISGPSATSDIELERVEGVHGPRNLHVIVALD